MSGTGWKYMLILTFTSGVAAQGLLVFAQKSIQIGTISIAQVAQPAPARAALEAATAWHRDAGGGEQAALGECLLAALDSDEPRLAALLDAARSDDDAPVEVFALDALARIAAERGDTATELRTAADHRMAAASHFITERDRTDRPADSARRTPAAR